VPRTKTRKAKPYIKDKDKRDHHKKLELVFDAAIKSIEPLPHSITIHVVPGGGKTLAAIAAAAKAIDSGLIDRVIIVTPRKSLCEQMKEDFADWKQFNMGVTVRIVRNNEVPFIRDIGRRELGYVTTYQALSANPDVHVSEMNKPGNDGKALRWLIIFDEFHHIAKQAKWCSSVRAIGDLPNVVSRLLMTGTLARADGLKIPYVDYQRKEDGNEYPRVDIRYGRRIAIAEEAIRPVYFAFQDGDLQNRSAKKGAAKTLTVSTLPRDDSRIYAAAMDALIDINLPFGAELLTKGLDDWIGCRDDAVVRWSYEPRCIVVADSISDADRIVDHINKTYRSRRVVAVKATSDDVHAHKVIKAFRERREGNVLVTVNMAHEGLDVPDCTHLIYLSRTRSIPYLTQVIGRITRVDYEAIGGGRPAREQWAKLYAPADPRMMDAVTIIEKEQLEAANDAHIGNLTAVSLNGSGSGSGSYSAITIFATPTTITYGALGDELSPKLSDIINRLYADPELKNLDFMMAVAIARVTSASDPEIVEEVKVRTKDSKSKEWKDPWNNVDVDDEGSLRRGIDRMCLKLDARTGNGDFGATARKFKQMYGVERSALSLSELRKQYQQAIDMCKKVRITG